MLYIKPKERKYKIDTPTAQNYLNQVRGAVYFEHHTIPIAPTSPNIEEKKDRKENVEDLMRYGNYEIKRGDRKEHKLGINESIYSVRLNGNFRSFTMRNVMRFVDIILNDFLKRQNPNNMVNLGIEFVDYYGKVSTGLHKINQISVDDVLERLLAISEQRIFIYRRKRH